MILPTATAVEIIQLQEDHKSECAKFWECQDVEKSLLRHIQDAIEEKYI